MTLVLIYAATLLAAVLLSGLARRSILSTTVIFLAAGFLTGNIPGLVRLRPTDESVRLMSELALFSVLFTDGMRIQQSELRSTWRLPSRALLLGLPLTLLFTAVLAKILVGIPWTEALLLGAVLSPTDPVLATAIIGRQEVPIRLRRLLNVESGLNDGLALPFVLILLQVVAKDSVQPQTIAFQILFGIALGVAIPLVAIWLERLDVFTATAQYEPLNGMAIGLLILGATSVTHSNSFLAAFVGGAVLSNVAPRISNSFNDLGEHVTEMLKLAAILLFGVLISITFLGEVSFGGYAFAVLALLLIRPLALAVALFRGGLSRYEWIAAAWFGPKGFASVVFGLLIVTQGTHDASLLFHVAAIVVALSIVLHSSTDVIVAEQFEKLQAETA